MNTTSGEIAVVSTHCERTDRRALSQAWYSALHVAQRDTVERAPRATPMAASVGSGGSSVAPGRHPIAPARTASANVQRAKAVREPALSTAIERRAPKSELTKRIERVLAAQSRRARPATSLAIHAADGRVHLIVRTHGNTTRIMALCVPELEARVARALAQARFALARHGVRSEVSC